ncbi:fumarate reductase flavoprotein subunit [Sporobacter termitidis DSM 10068]|uniref:Fumarate reductase flavoprotein subunit n=1 Tax=Sporobacter termitidis DSM 10068 TaxID=1123282 RepID=A0A1M5UFV6_9FIRM|nr:flavocytochrome c [Sporobacter termitidis]SHH61859.1 fumarate reductase flavoprotein subunit [Sporobacter termitidis DSM 10068]
MRQRGQLSGARMPEHWDEAVDVVVIGSGFAGLAAAAAARVSGAQVLILEKMPYFGGNSILAGGGYSCWDSKLKLREKLELGGDSWEKHMEDTLRGGGYYNNPALVEVLVRGAPDGLDWLADNGAVFKETLPRLGGHSAHRSYQAGCNLAEVVKKHALSLGAELRLNTAITALCRNGTAGPVAGVLVSAGGAERAIAARRGVVIASGGFGSDLKLRTAYQPALGGAYNTTNHKGATGEMIKLALAAGADTIHMEFIQLYPCAEPVSGRLDAFAFDCYSGPGYGLIYVNGSGRRFVSELAGRDIVSNAQVSAGKRPTYAILNGAIFDKLARSAEAVKKGVSSGRLITAGTIPQLARDLGIPPENLADTVGRHNAAIEAGVDQDFGKPVTAQMLPLAEGPFYAISQWPSVHYTMGGLRINTEAQVLDIRGNTIPGLYAAGEVCGGIHGSNRLGGNAIAECIVFGRIAGKNAAGHN